MKFIGINTYVMENEIDDDWISISVEGAKNENSIGDQVWFSEDGLTMEIHAFAEISVLREAESLFSDRSSKFAFRGALRRLGVRFED
jgi:hypothetical protein